MFNKIKVLIAKWKLRKWFKPAENHELSRLGNLYGVYKYVFSEQGNHSVDYPIKILATNKNGWLENDKHYRKRINSHLNLI